MTLLSKITLVFVAVVIVLLSLWFISLASDPAKKVGQFYEATKQGKCDDIDKYFDRDPEQKKEECRRHAGTIADYRIKDVTISGIPGILEWASVDTEITFVDGKVSKPTQQLVKTLVTRWKLTYIP